MPPFLEIVADGRGMESAKEHGSPHTLVVAAAGLRAADIARSVLLILDVAVPSDLFLVQSTARVSKERGLGCQAVRQTHQATGVN
jgi:hypothetical protein